jgi:hypothetical protein
MRVRRGRSITRRGRSLDFVTVLSTRPARTEVLRQRSDPMCLLPPREMAAPTGRGQLRGRSQSASRYLSNDRMEEQRIVTGQRAIRHRNLTPPTYTELLPKSIGVSLRRSSRDT